MIVFILAVAIMLFLILGGAWIAISLGFSGVIALWPKLGNRLWDLIGIHGFTTSTNFVLLAVPLFVFMGEFMGRSGIMGRVYKGLIQLLQGVPGGLEQTNVAACGVFAAISGSSVAGAATMGRVAYPELTRRGYDRRLTLGSVTAGGTLGILIPPSIPLIIYGLIAEESVGALFMAGVLPGLLLILLYMLYIGTRATIQRGLVPREIREVGGGWQARLRGFLEVWPFVLLMGLVLGTIYLGVATPTEAAALGAVGAIAVAAFFRQLSWAAIMDSLLATVRTTSMVILIVVCAKIVVQAIVYYGIHQSVGQWITGIGSPATYYLFICISYFVLGCFFEPLSMMILTVPLFVPALVALGFSKVWFGIVVSVSCEIGLLTPPVGINLFVMQGVTGEPLGDIVKGSWPFIFLNVLLLVILYLWPKIALWLPNTMFGA